MLVANPSKARGILQWEPKVSLSELVGMMVDSDLKRLGKELA
jgi:GDPmannose 4,6-dehydratase